MDFQDILAALPKLSKKELKKVIREATNLLTNEPINTTENPLKTEDTGKIFEMAICLAYSIPYDGPYKYGLEKPEELTPRLKKLTELFPTPQHTAKKGARYDFTSTTTSEHLSAKTAKKGCGKVAPQVIGQSKPQKFCEIINTPFTDIPHLKEHIQTHIKNILPILVEYTFDCPNIYYNEQTSLIKYVKLHTPIDWNAYTYTWTCHWDTWNNSSTLKILHNEKETPLVEFQFHTKSRTNMAIRWCYDNFLSIFKDNLTIIDL
jgi:hypothetical protein